MIELAPRSKAGLLVTSPILLAAGIIGCGDALPPSLRRAEIGAAVTGPISRSSRRGARSTALSRGRWRVRPELRSAESRDCPDR